MYAPHRPRCRESAVQRADTKVRAPAALVVVPRGPGLLVEYRTDGSAHRHSPIPEGSQKLAGGRAKRHPRSTAPKRCRHPGGVRESVAKQHGAVRGQPIWGAMPPLPAWVIRHAPSGRTRRSAVPRRWLWQERRGPPVVANTLGDLRRSYLEWILRRIQPGALTLSAGCPNNDWPPVNVSLKGGHSASVSKRPPFSSPLSHGSSLGRRPRWPCHTRWLHNVRQSGIVDDLVGRIPAAWTVTRCGLLSDPRLERRVVHRAVCEDLVQRRRVRRVTPAVPRRLRGHPAAQPLRCFRA